MELITNFISEHGVEILYAIITFVATYLGGYIKSIITKQVNDKTKQDVAKTCVKAVEQIYKDLHGDEKLQKAIEAASEMLANKNITITDIELRMLIESAVSEFNNAFSAVSDAQVGFAVMPETEYEPK